ncbi:hypothetical protein B0H13DRAFT_2313716 [Mycena leptocephala]|nr:hypothetical protein B0H13DRAFT_2313716 [Mycena leptocephala]
MTHSAWGAIPPRASSRACSAGDGGLVDSARISDERVKMMPDPKHHRLVPCSLDRAALRERERHRWRASGYRAQHLQGQPRQNSDRTTKSVMREQGLSWFIILGGDWTYVRPRGPTMPSSAATGGVSRQVELQGLGAADTDLDVDIGERLLEHLLCMRGGAGGLLEEDEGVLGEEERVTLHVIGKRTGQGMWVASAAVGVHIRAHDVRIGSARSENA